MRRAVFLGLAMCMFGCPGTVSGLDAGTEPTDAGPVADAGVADAGASDAGAPRDAGTWDGGSVRDAGPFVEPAWHVGLPLNTWTEIPNTSGAGGAAINAWGALAENKRAAELYIAASGGHSDSSDNRVVSLNLLADAPVWVQRHAPSANPVVDVLYYPDGLPTSRHLYAHLHYLPTLDVVLLGGCRYGYGGGTPTGPGMDAFDLTTNQWLPRQTFPDITPFNAYVIEVDDTGAAWTASGNKFNPATRTWSTPGSGPGLGRFPHAAAPGFLFSLQFGDGQGYDLNLGVVARKLDTTTGNTVAITFTPSAALTEFIAAQPTYAGMDFDAANNRFLFYHGAEQGKVYAITPNATTTWDLSVLATTGMPAATPSSGAGINKRFRSLPTLQGFVLMPTSTSNLWFLRTSN